MPKYCALHCNSKGAHRLTADKSSEENCGTKLSVQKIENHVLRIFQLGKHSIFFQLLD